MNHLRKALTPLSHSLNPKTPFTHLPSLHQLFHTSGSRATYKSLQENLEEMMVQASPTPRPPKENIYHYNKSESSLTQFMEFIAQFSYKKTKIQCIKAVTCQIDDMARSMLRDVQLVHLYPSLPVAEKHVGYLRNLFVMLGLEINGRGEYLRYHEHWRSETQRAVCVLAMIHWLKTTDLLYRTEAEEKLGLSTFEYGLDAEDYLLGLCLMSKEMVRYAVNQATAGNYDCLKGVLHDMLTVYASVQLVNVQNDCLLKKLDEVQQDLEKVQELYYNLKIQGLIEGSYSKGMDLSRKESSK